jgi:hypothetical protein
MRYFLPALVAVALLLPAAARAADLTVDAASNFTIEAMINGQPVRLRVDPEVSGYVILNPATVERIGLRRSMLGSRTQIGPVRLTGSSKVAEVSIGGVTGDRRVVWIDRPAIDGADGLIGPADMHYEHVVFTLGAARGGEATFVLPLEFERSFGLYFPLTIGEHDFRFQFSLTKPASLATAGAGAALAALHGGTWAGGALDQVIEFGVVRPVREMVLARPVELQGFRVGLLRVRTGDNRGNLDLPPDPDADPDEVVVTGGSRQRAAFVVHVGLDRLQQCSRLEWNNLTRRLTLNCTNLTPTQPAAQN